MYLCQVQLLWEFCLIFRKSTVLEIKWQTGSQYDLLHILYFLVHNRFSQSNLMQAWMLKHCYVWMGLHAKHFAFSHALFRWLSATCVIISQILGLLLDAKLKLVAFWSNTIEGFLGAIGRVALTRPAISSLDLALQWSIHAAFTKWNRGFGLVWDRLELRHGSWWWR